MEAPHTQKCFKIIKSLPLFTSTSTSTVSSPPHHPIFSLLQRAQNHTSKHPTHLKALHSLTITSGLIGDPFAASRIVQFFLQQNPTNLTYTTAVFDSLAQPDAYTWNLMIASHAELDSSDHCIPLYFRMRAKQAQPNPLTFGLLLKSCNGSRETGTMVHCQVLKCGAQEFIVIKNSLIIMYCNLGLLNDARLLFDTSSFLDLRSWNTLISAYGKNGEVETARFMFDEMPQRNLVSWSALMDGYVRKGDCDEALRLFDRLRAKGLELDEVVLVSVLKACAQRGGLDQGRAIHRYIDRRGLGRRDGDVVLETAVVDMYCKCGCVDEASEVFDRVYQNGDAVLWNAMINGLAMHGESRRALKLFKRMIEHRPKVVPNKSTYISVLRACTHAGTVDEGIEIFELMKGDGIEPQREHYGCLADLMGRAGLVREAEEVLLTMPMEPESSQWGALMSACQTHKDVEVGQRVGRKLIEMEPFDGGRYVSLANLYAAVGEWEKAKEIRREMEEKGAKKKTGQSSIK